MLYEVCKEINNFFETEKVFKDFTISNGHVSPSDFLLANQYFRICGSVYNDGIHKLSDALTDEEFKGSVWKMSIPQDFLDLSNEIETFNNKNEVSPFSSESFGGYSYAKSGNTWQSAFSERLNMWRKI